MSVLPSVRPFVILVTKHIIELFNCIVVPSVSRVRQNPAKVAVNGGATICRCDRKITILDQLETTQDWLNADIICNGSPHSLIYKYSYVIYRAASFAR